MPTRRLACRRGFSHARGGAFFNDGAKRFFGIGYCQGADITSALTRLETKNEDALTFRRDGAVRPLN